MEGFNLHLSVVSVDNVSPLRGRAAPLQHAVAPYMHYSWPVAKPVAERDVLGPHGRRTSTVGALVEKSRDSAQRGRIFAPVSRTRKLAAQGLHVRTDGPVGLLRGICCRLILHIPASSLK